MSLVSTDFDFFKEEIELIQSQNPVECELYSIVASIIRGSEQRNKISLRDFSARRRSKMSRPFYGDGGFPDFVILGRGKNEKIPLGAIEVKRISEELDKHLKQLEKHVGTFENVIHTNGLVWRYYESDMENLKWEIILGEIHSGKIIWKDESGWIDLNKKLDNETNWGIK